MESQWNKDRQHDWDDYNNELSSVEVGLLQRFLTDNETDIYGDDRKKKEERQHLNRLEQLLIDEACQALYQSTLRSLYETQSVVYEALKDAGETLQRLEAQRTILLEQASTLPSGERVFLDEDGSAYTEDGRKLTDDEFVQVDWKEGSPSWDEFTQNRDDVRQAQERHAEMQRHSKRLEEIEHEMKDDKHRPSEERLEELNDEISKIQRSIDMSGQDDTLHLEQSSPVKVPELKF